MTTVGNTQNYCVMQTTLYTATVWITHGGGRVGEREGGWAENAVKVNNRKEHQSNRNRK